MRAKSINMKLRENIRHVTSPSGEVHFLFNTDGGTWATMKQNVYEFLQAAISCDEDPLLLGLRMGFNHEELNQFLSTLLDLSLLKGKDGEASALQLSKCYFHVTEACNLTCPTCYSWRPRRNERKDDDLPTELVGEALRQMSDLGLTELVISGGEPLLRRDLIKILQMAKEEYRLDMVVLLTNGTLINEQNASDIALYADVVCVSLDGLSEEMNRKIRGRGNWVKATEAIRVLKAAGARRVNLLPTLTHQNVHQMEGFLGLADSLGATVSFSMFIGVGAGSKEQELALTASDMLTMAKTLDKINIAQSKSIPMGCSVGLASLAGCGIGHRVIALDHDGTVYPCHMTMKPELRMGKFPEQSLKEIWTSSPLATHFREFNVDRFNGCSKCFVRYFCGGGCRANAYAVSGDLLSSDPSCQFYKPVLVSMIQPILEAGSR